MTTNSELPWSILLPKGKIAPGDGSSADCGVADAKGRVIGEFWLECPGPGGNDDLVAPARGNAELAVRAVNGLEALRTALFGMLEAYWPQNQDGTWGDGGKPPKMVVQAHEALEATKP